MNQTKKPNGSQEEWHQWQQKQVDIFFTIRDSQAEKQFEKVFSIDEDFRVSDASYLNFKVKSINE